ncbi:hypothetical protein AGMMS49959_00400 [Planctomycetales bacterium]|nr:hypothetical protein AGMMS49959_00400 [Planctomycetales bacterium]
MFGNRQRDTYPPPPPFFTNRYNLAYCNSNHRSPHGRTRFPLLTILTLTLLTIAGIGEVRAANGTAGRNGTAGDNGDNGTSAPGGSATSGMPGGNGESGGDGSDNGNGGIGGKGGNGGNGGNGVDVIWDNLSGTTVSGAFILSGGNGASGGNGGNGGDGGRGDGSGSAGLGGSGGNGGNGGNGGSAIINNSGTIEGSIVLSGGNAGGGGRGGQGGNSGDGKPASDGKDGRAGTRGSAQLNNEGTINLTGNSTLGDLTNRASGVININNSITLNTGSTIINHGNINIAVGETTALNGAGIITTVLNGTGSVKIDGTLNVANFTNNSNINISNTGTLSTASDLTNNGNINITTGTATLNGSGGLRQLTGSGSVNIAGTLNTVYIANRSNINLLNGGNLGADAYFSNDGNINVAAGNTATLTIAGGNLTGSGYVNISGTLNTGTLTNNSNINFNGGVMAVTGNYDGGTGTHNFNLRNYAKDGATGAGGDSAIVTISVTGSFDNSKIKLADASKGSYYLFDKGGNANTAALVSANTNTMRKFVGRADGDKLYADVSTNTGGILDAANGASSSNAGLGGALAEMIDREILPQDISDALFAQADRGAAAFGHAVSELNHTNVGTATAQVVRSASQQFNTALGQVFGSDFAAQTDARTSRIGSVSRSRASLGGYGSTASGYDSGYGYGYGSRYADRHFTGFAKVYGGFGAQGSNRDAAGYEFGGVGVLAGIGYQFAKELEFGGLLGYAYNDATTHDGYGDSTDNVLRLGAYGNYQWGNFFFNSAPTFAAHMLKSRRQIAFMKRTAVAERGGWDFAWYNRAGYTFELPQKYFITPSFAISPSYMHDPEYTETGAGSANLKVEEYGSWSVLQNLEARFGKVWFGRGDLYAVVPELWVGWEHEYLSSNDATVAFAAVPGNKWNAPIKDLAADRATFGLGLTVDFFDYCQLNARYDQKIWDGGSSSTFTLSANARF